MAGDALDPGEILTVKDCAMALQITARGVRDGCEAGRYPGSFKNSEGAWCIPLPALPTEAQARHLVSAIGAAESTASMQLSPEEAESLWGRFGGGSEKAKERAYRDAEACRYWQLCLTEGKPRKETAQQIRERFDIKQSALYEKLGRIAGYDPMHWPALLAGQWQGAGGRRAEWPTEAWKCFIREALPAGSPIKTAWKRTRNEAKRQGWGKIPGYDKAKADYEAIDYDVRVLLKEGETALKARSPTAQRDYSTLPLHDTWSMDGRRLDVWCIDRHGKYAPRGTVFRPWIYAFAETRSRYFLGYAIGQRLDSDLPMAAFLNVTKNTGRIVPREFEPDNGMEIAAKQNTGGVPWRRRGTVKDDEMFGRFTRLGIEIGWTSVAHGQAKIIERIFGTVGTYLETRHEFRGAYCGNNPSARPEECDRARAIDVERIEALIDQSISDYNQEPGHRGQGMEGKSPHLVYIEQSRAPGLAMRQISAAQERICAYSAAPITISRKDNGFTLLGARYWSEGTAKLPPGAGYSALYNPADLSDTVYVYRGPKRLCEAQRRELTPYNSKPAAKAIMRQRAGYTRKVKEAAKALEDLIAAEGAGLDAQLPKLRAGEMMDVETGEIRERPSLPKSDIRALVPSRTDLLPAAPAKPTEEEERFNRQLAEFERQEEQKAIDSLRKRVAGRR